MSDYLWNEKNNTFTWLSSLYNSFKDTHWEKALSNKTPVLIKSMNMGIWVFGTWNQPFVRGA